MKIHYINRLTKKEEEEQVFGKAFLHLLYGEGKVARLFSFLFLPFVARSPFFSRFYGTLQKRKSSKRNIQPFIEQYKVDTSEFLLPVEAFHSFNDFFIRKLKPSCRPFAQGEDVAILPADGRYLVYPHIASSEGFLIKGEKFSLEELLQDKALAHKYAEGSLVIARLCPVDYHRFHFPCAGTPEPAQLINGPLFSVNPVALKKNIHILSENKRVITPFHTKNFGTILYIDVGATAVGTIHQTFTPHKPCAKGDEKGYFSFGGSCLLLLFEPGRIHFDQDLLDASRRSLETLGRLGQPLGKKGS